MVLRKGELYYNDDGEHKYDLEHTKKNYRYGHNNDNLSCDEETQLKIKETAEIIKYTFKPDTKSRKKIGKSDIINLRSLIGMEMPKSWISRSWILPAFELAGFKDNRISKSFHLLPPTIYFNLNWIHNVPKDICDMIVSYVGIPTDTMCSVCQKECYSQTKLDKHNQTKMHKIRLAKAPEYFK